MTAARSWANHDLIEWHPDLAPMLPGYADAVARGFKDYVAPIVETPTKQRVKRTVADLTEERDALVAKRALISPEQPFDHGALSGIRRKPNGADRKQGATTDRDLARYAELNRRIEQLNYRIRKEST